MASICICISLVILRQHVPAQVEYPPTRLIRIAGIAAAPTARMIITSQAHAQRRGPGEWAIKLSISLLFSEG